MGRAEIVRLVEVFREALLQESLPAGGPAFPARPAAPRLAGVRLDNQFFAPAPLEKPPRRILDPRYLQHLRSLPCCACPEGEQTEPTEAHHFGPRAAGRRTHDWLCCLLCGRCHRRYHRCGDLPGRSPAEARLYLLFVQADLLLQYFAPILPLPLAHRTGRLVQLVHQLPAGEQEGALRLVLDDLVEHLVQLRGRSWR